MSTNTPAHSKNDILGKQLPANLNAERSVLGAILLNDAAWQMLNELVKAEDF